MRVPCVKMGYRYASASNEHMRLRLFTIEVKDLDLTISVHLLQRPKGRQSQAMIATERKQLGFGGYRRHRSAHSQLFQGLRHLLLGYIIIDRRYRNISAIHDLGPVLIWINVCSGIVTAEGVLTT